MTFREAVLNRTAGLSLDEMAELLAVSKPYACQLRSGARGKRLSHRVSQRVLQLWPSLIDAYLRDVLTEDSDRPSTTPAEPQAVA